MSAVKALQDYIFTSKYARWLPDKQRRETWNEAVDRVRNMMLEKYADCGIEDDINWAYDMVKQKKVLGSQRALQFGGKDAIKHNLKIYNCSYSPANRIRFFQECLYVLLCGVGAGFSVQKHHVDQLPDLKSKDEYFSLPEETFTIPDSIEGWSDSIGVLMTSCFSCQNDDTWAKKRVKFDYSKIRPKGAPIGDGTGKAPGPDGLRRSLELTQSLIEQRILEGNSRLKPIDVYDITCHLSDAVLSGGIRRCLPYDSKVLMEDGKFKTLYDIKAGEKIRYKDRAYTIIAKEDTGVRNLIKIDTKCGYQISTPEHRWLVYDFADKCTKWAEAKAIYEDPNRYGLQNEEYDVFPVINTKHISHAQTYDIQIDDVECFNVKSNGSDLVSVSHNSALLTMFSHDDQEMLEAKTGNWWLENPQRQRSNNSAVLMRDEVTQEQFNDIIQNTKEFGEPGFVFVSDKYDVGYNPCFSGDTLILTKDGYRKIRELYESGDFVDVVSPHCVIGDKFNEQYVRKPQCSISNASPVALTQYNADVFKITTQHKYSIVVTKTHKFPTLHGIKRVDELTINDTLLLYGAELPIDVDESSDKYQDGLIIGLLTSDGTFGKNDAIINIWNDDFDVLDNIKNIVWNKIKSLPSNTSIYKDYIKWTDRTPGENSTSKCIVSARLRKWLYNYINEDPTNIKKHVPDVIMQGDDNLVAGYIAGMVFGDGTISKSYNIKHTPSIRISQTNLTLLKDIQILLSRFGIVCNIYLRHKEGYRYMPDGNGGRKKYYCNNVYELIISRPNMVTFEKYIPLYGRKKHLLKLALDKSGRKCYKNKTVKSKIVDIKYIGKENVYCLHEPVRNSIVANGICTGNCLEIGLFPYLVKDPQKFNDWLASTNKKLSGDLDQYGVEVGWQMCNLSTINCAKLKGTLEEKKQQFLDGCKAAAILGTLQAGFTKFPYLGETTEKICEKEALIGVSMTGMMDNFETILDPTVQAEGARVVKETNKRLAEKIGINKAARTTCLKPEGCRPANALVTTNQGIFTLEELMKDHPDGISWSDLDNYDCHGGQLKRSYKNGKSPTKIIHMLYGLSVISTPNHPWYVVNKYDFIEAKDIEQGDILDINLNSYINNEHSSLLKFSPDDPEYMNTELAELLAYYYSGIDNRKLLLKYFGCQYNQDWRFQGWLNANNININSSTLPLVLRTSSANDIRAFINTLFDLNNTFACTDGGLIDHIQHVALSVGIILKKTTYYSLERVKHLDNIVGVVEKVQDGPEIETMDVETEQNWFYAGAVKSHNTASLTLGTLACGIHPHHYIRYIRTVQANTDEDVYQFFKKHNPQACEKSLTSNTGTDDVIYFPIEVPDGAKTKNQLDALTMLRMVKSTQINWVMNGKRYEQCVMNTIQHNVSNTVVVKDDEWEDVAKFIYDNRDYFTGVSLLSASGDKDYPQAPFCAVYTSRQIVREYGDAALWVAGLITLAEEAFDGHLYNACMTLLNYNGNDELSDQQKDFCIRAKKFADKYMDGNLKRLTYCMKDVSNWKRWCDLNNSFVTVDYTKLIETEDNTKPVDTVACAGGACLI